MTQASLRKARIDLSAIRDNVERLTNARFVADVAGDAFGHGAVQVARAALAAGASTIGVRDADEERDLRDAGIDAPIVVSLDAGSDESAAIYGLGPLAVELALLPAMRVSARVVSLKTIGEGEAVSYGYTWRAPVQTNLALIPLGYADGVMRAAGNRGRVLLGGAMRTIAGRVAMDVIVLDLGADEVGVGDEAVLFGDPMLGSATANEWAQPLGIPALEVTSGIGARVPRRWV